MPHGFLLNRKKEKEKSIFFKATVTWLVNAFLSSYHKYFMEDGGKNSSNVRKIISRN
jgi:argonaute-like protein implicated in RNA metabolism and viral defense